jgi:alpha-ketoglutarate-dependent taurine dioxygenase
MKLNLRPLSPALGAEVVDIDLSRKLDADTVAALRQAWLDHLILLFRGQELTEEQLVEATGLFGPAGELARPEEYRTPGQKKLHQTVMLISNVRENGVPIGALPDGEMMFHHDMLHAEVPHDGTLLYAREIPSTGGNTLFANLYAAYDELPDEVRAPLEGRRAFHHYNYGEQTKGDGKGVTAFAESLHPAFRTHPDTGKKAIYVNRLMTEYVDGLPREQSDALLARVFDHAEQARFVYEHVWRVGDAMLWDNRCTMHARTDFPPERRLFWRTTVAGTGRPY